MKRKILKILSVSAAVLFCVLSMAVAAAGLYLETHFERTFPSELLSVATDGGAPRFYLYQFTDRANRIGEKKEITEEIGMREQYTPVAYQDIPQQLRDAFVAVEDKRFWQHRGVDWKRTAVAVGNYLLGKKDTFGASTITQQLVKNLTGDDEITPKRKIQEMLYALDLENRLDKTQILELYLNIIHFSDNCNGVAQAAEHYFSKSVGELTVEECAAIAAITNSPSYYNPIRHPENNRKRRNIILSEMNRQGLLSDDACQAALQAPLCLQVTPSERDGVHSWYTDMVLEDVIEDLVREYHIGRNAAYRMLTCSGLRIEIAMDEEIQSTVEQYYSTLQTPRNGDGVCAQSALIVLDAATGDILGVAGARGTKSGNRLQNFATQTLRSPGSAIKPLSVYAPALEKGIIHWGSVYDDVPVEFTGAEHTVPWPKNANGIYRGLTDVSYAVMHSTNTVAVRVLEELGTAQSFDFAKNRCHLSHLRRDSAANDCDVAALALGQLNYGVTLREMTAAYAVFADGGVYHPYRSYYRVLTADGHILLSCPDASEPVLSEGNAAVMTKLLRGVVESGTASDLRLSEQTEFAGKTGTTNRDYDRWFIGYTPEFICGVWCGFEYPAPLEGGNPCLSVFDDVMGKVMKLRGSKTAFDVPQSLLRLTYCADSGKLMTDACLADARGNRAREGWFVPGNEPTEFCDCHVLCTVNDADGSISAEPTPREGQHSVGFLRLHRQFPVPVTVSDETYVLTLPPGKEEDE